MNNKKVITDRNARLAQIQNIRDELDKENEHYFWSLVLKERKHKNNNWSKLQNQVRKDKDPDDMDISDATSEESDHSYLGAEQKLINAIFGFDEFKTTKNLKNRNQYHGCEGIVSVPSKRKYRQYMNRPGGFNRPLDPVL